MTDKRKGKKVKYLVIATVILALAGCEFLKFRTSCYPDPLRDRDCRAFGPESE